MHMVESAQYLSMKMNKSKILLNEFKSIITKDNELIKIFCSKQFLLFSKKMIMNIIYKIFVLNEIYEN